VSVVQPMRQSGLWREGDKVFEPTRQSQKNVGAGFAYYAGRYTQELASMKFRISLLLCAVFITSCVQDHTETVQWEGHALHEVRSLSALPASIQSALGVGRQVMEGVAERGGPFNVTDVVDSNLPMRRFLVAGIENDLALIALEHGGRGYGVEVFLFSVSAQQSTPKQKWTLLTRPGNLKDVVEQLKNAEKHDGQPAHQDGP